MKILWSQIIKFWTDFIVCQQGQYTGGVNSCF